MYKWLSYGCVFGISSFFSFDPADSYFERREWSRTTHEIYSRYHSFTGLKHFRDETISKCPDKLDIGAVFNAPVCFFQF
jgi:DNA primase catalytic subunit